LRSAGDNRATSAFLAKKNGISMIDPALDIGFSAELENQNWILPQDLIHGCAFQAEGFSHSAVGHQPIGNIDTGLDALV